MFLCPQHANLGVLTTLRMGHDNTGKDACIGSLLLAFSVVITCDLNVWGVQYLILST